MNRREFVATGVGAVAAGSWPRPAIRFGYAAITWNGNDRQAIDDISALGFRGIQLRQPAFDTWHDRPAELAALLHERGLTFVALSSGEMPRAPVDEAATLETHVHHAQFVRDVGGRYLQVIDQRPQGRDPGPADFKRMGRLLTELGRRSADLGIPLGYHNHMGALGQSPDEVARVLDAADPRYVRLLLDIAHYQWAGGDPADAVRRHAGRLLFLHVKDLAGDRFVELGRGTVDIKAVFSALDQVGFEGWAVVELDSVPDASRTPKECGAVARRYLEALGWNVAR